MEPEVPENMHASMDYVDARACCRTLKRKPRDNAVHTCSIHTPPGHLNQTWRTCVESTFPQDARDKATRQCGALHVQYPHFPGTLKLLCFPSSLQESECTLIVHGIHGCVLKLHLSKKLVTRIFK